MMKFFKNTFFSLKSARRLFAEKFYGPCLGRTSLTSRTGQDASTHKATEGQATARCRAGQAALPFVLLVGSIITVILVTGAVVAFSMSSTSLGEQLSARALAAANSGVYDAILRASNNKEFGAGGTTYSFNVGSDSVSLDVSRTTDNTNNIYIYVATSTATAASRQRRLRASFLVDRTTGEVNLRAVEEKPIN